MKSNNEIEFRNEERGDADERVHQWGTEEDFFNSSTSTFTTRIASSLRYSIFKKIPSVRGKKDLTTGADFCVLVSPALLG